MSGTELRHEDDGWSYDRAILKWRSAPSGVNYDAMIREQQVYYTGLRGYTYLDDEPALVAA